MQKSAQTDRQTYYVVCNIDTVIRVPNEFGFLGVKDSPEFTLDLTKVLFNSYKKF